MIRSILTIATAVTGISCSRPPCNRSTMVDVINEEIRNHGIKASEFFIADVREEGSNVVYVGVAYKAEPSYRRHYLFDARSCSLREAWADQ